MNALREEAELATANEWETPVTLSGHLGEAADMVEKLAAENERLKARCDAAERDMAPALAVGECQSERNRRPGKE